MKARQLERRAEALDYMIRRVRELRRDADGRFIAEAERALRAELALTVEELASKRVPQRARKTKNASRAEWEEVRRQVRGLAEEQLTLDGRTVGDVLREELARKGIAP